MFKDTHFQDTIDFSIVSGTFNFLSTGNFDFRNIDLFVFTKSGKDFYTDVKFKSMTKSMFMMMSMFGSGKQIYAQDEGFLTQYSKNVMLNSIQLTTNVKQDHKKDFVLFKYRPFTVNQWVYQPDKDVLSMYSDCLDSLKNNTIDLIDAYKQIYSMMTDEKKKEFEKYVKNSYKTLGGNFFMEPVGELDKLLRKK